MTPDQIEASFAKDNPKIAAIFQWAKDYDQTPSAELNAIKYNLATVLDILGNLRRWGKLSEKQIAFVERLHTEALAKVKDKAKEIKKAQKLIDSGVKLTEGRQEIEGTIQSVKLVENDFGSAYKAVIVLDSGLKVYGTVPGNALGDAGDKVKFVGTVTPSDRDPLFGFYKRPSKWVNLSQPQVA